VLLVEKSRWPREKVCGGCLNHSAIQTLREAGLGHAIAGAQSLDRVEWRCGQKTVAVPMPSGVAMLRSDLDAALVAEAVKRGCTFVSGIVATLLPGRADESTRSILLRRGECSATVAAEMVLACDGIGGTSVQSEPWSRWKIARRGWFGIAATLERADEPKQTEPSGLPRVSQGRSSTSNRLGANPRQVTGLCGDDDGGISAANAAPPGAICMQLGDGGYVGLVRMADGQVHLAAALDPRACRRAGGPGRVIASILESTGIRLPDLKAARLQGTGIMTRHRRSLGGHRVLAVGDACGYVEPFTGEGMAWAMRAAATAAAMLPAAGEAWPADMAALWQSAHAAMIGRRQRWCRFGRAVVHHPQLASALIGVGSLLPWISQELAAHVCGVEESFA
jgi:flavin-dependent dehydrogenase